MVVWREYQGGVLLRHGPEESWEEVVVVKVYEIVLPPPQVGPHLRRKEESILGGQGLQAHHPYRFDRLAPGKPKGLVRGHHLNLKAHCGLPPGYLGGVCLGSSNLGIVPVDDVADQSVQLRSVEGYALWQRILPP